MILLQTILLFVGMTEVASFREFKLDIPNGENVPNPCIANTKWKAPGHLNILGGGKRNPFGDDFDKAGRKWTKELCQADSDGDGWSNGLELGDVNCTWTKESGDPPSVTLLNSLSHPGVCEPMNSVDCQGKNAEGLCRQKAEFECDFNVAGIDNDVTAITLQLEETEVPAQETTYICQSFKLDDYLPNPTISYHKVGSEPVLVNENVMHHIIVYVCADDLNMAKLRKPGPCSMMVSECSSLGGWTVGQSGECSLGDFGHRIAAESHDYIVLETHWNNPLLHRGTYDSSGIKLYITPNIRTYDLGVMDVGPMNLRLEPGKDRIEQTGVCTAACTQKILQDKEIYVVDASNHMHYLGKEAYLEVLRNGRVVHTLAVDKEFEYDTPITYEHNPPLSIKAGDEIRMKCVYKTTSRTNTVFYGDGTQAEMCFGFITFYPNILHGLEASCVDWDGLDTCELGDRMAQEGCNEVEFWTKTSTYTHLYALFSKCNLETCTQSCLDELKSWYEDEPCLKDRSIRSYMTFVLGMADTEQLEGGESVANMMRVCNKQYNDMFARAASTNASNTTSANNTTKKPKIRNFNSALDDTAQSAGYKSVYGVAPFLFALLFSFLKNTCES